MPDTKLEATLAKMKEQRDQLEDALRAMPPFPEGHRHAKLFNKQWSRAVRILHD